MIEAEWAALVPEPNKEKPTLFAFRNKRVQELYAEETDPDVLAAVQMKIKESTNKEESPAPTFEDEDSVAPEELERRRIAWRYQE